MSTVAVTATNTPYSVTSSSTYTHKNVPTITFSPIDGTVFTSATQVVTITVTDSDNATYKVNGGTAVGFTGNTSVTLNATSTIDVTAQNSPFSVASAATYTYKEPQNKIVLTLSNGTTSSVTYSDGVIPASAFTNNSTIVSVKIGDDITSIGNKAFYYCSGLTSVTFGSGLTTIGNQNFQGCDKLTGITVPDGVTTIGTYFCASCDGLKSVVIPDSVTSVGANLCYYSEALTSVTLSNNMTSIGSNSFTNCSGLTSLVIPDSVTTLGDYVGYYAWGLKSLTIGSGVTTIGRNCFYDANVCTSITFNGTIAQWSSMTRGVNFCYNATRTVHCTDGDTTR